MKVRLDLNTPEFQREWFNLEKNEFNATKNTLRKLSSMQWEQVYNDKGINGKKFNLLKQEKDECFIQSV